MQRKVKTPKRLTWPLVISQAGKSRFDSDWPCVQNSLENSPFSSRSMDKQIFTLFKSPPKC